MRRPRTTDDEQQFPLLLLWWSLCKSLAATNKWRLPVCVSARPNCNSPGWLLWGFLLHPAFLCFSFCTEWNLYLFKVVLISFQFSCYFFTFNHATVLLLILVSFYFYLFNWWNEDAAMKLKSSWNWICDAFMCPALFVSLFQFERSFVTLFLSFPPPHKTIIARATPLHNWKRSISPAPLANKGRDDFIAHFITLNTLQINPQLSTHTKLKSHHLFRWLRHSSPATPNRPSTTIYSSCNF